MAVVKDLNGNLLLPSIDGSSTERVPSTTTASASASNSTSWAHRPSALPWSQPRPMASPLPRPGGEVSSALLCSPPWQQRSDADAVRVQQLANNPPCHDHKPSTPKLPLLSPSGPFIQLFELYSILCQRRLSVPFHQGGKAQSQTCLSTELKIKVHCTCTHNASLLMFVRGQSI